MATRQANDDEFDDQFHQAELYTHLDRPESEEGVSLIPYPTVHPNDLVDDRRIPGPFSFVQSDCFLKISGLVVAVNMAALVVELSSHKESDQRSLHTARLVNSVCLYLYVAELMLRMFHFGRLFFVHQEGRWNLFDLIIVLAGLVDRVLVPLLPAHAEDDSGIPAFWVTVFGVIRAARLLRFLRLVKLVGIFMRSDFRWTQSNWFSAVTSGVIMSSVVIMGLETDLDMPMWDRAEDAILTFFVFELAVRIRHQGLIMFASDECGWNWLDLCIVLFGVFDQWLMRMWISLASGRQTRSELGEVLLLVRMFRLLRILRLLRLVKAVRPLYMLAMGIIEAMQSMLWVLLLTLVALYTSAILMTRVVGHGAMMGDASDIPEHTQERFKDVCTSMFTLFVLMNGQEWKAMEPLLDQYPGMKAIFVFFTILCSWALLSVMTGVVSDNMIAVREKQNQQDDIMLGERVFRIEQALGEISRHADTAGDGLLRKDLYNELLEIPHHLKKLQRVVPNVLVADFRNVFEWLDVDKSGKVRYEELVDSFLALSEPIRGKRLLQVDADVRKQVSSLNQQLDSLTEQLSAIGARSKERQTEILNCLDGLAST